MATSGSTQQVSGFGVIAPLLAALTCLPLAAVAGPTISTVAGIGTPGFSGDGGSATAASIRAPAKAALDAAGSLYFADSNNQRVRNISPDGTISTVAGNGVFAFGGDGGLATSASIRTPLAVAVDAGGNIFFSDYLSHRIRRIDAATGIVSTIAGSGPVGPTGSYSGDGGPAEAATLHIPHDIVFDAVGNLYIADTGNNRIRMIAAGTGVITTVAGGGLGGAVGGYGGDGGPATSALLNGPRSVRLDALGNIYIGDSNNHRVRRVDAASQVISTVAGNGTPSFSGDGGDAVAAGLNFPTSAIVDPAGNLYVGDANNHRVRVVSASCPRRRVSSRPWRETVCPAPQAMAGRRRQHG